ncbi:catenin alpha-2-like, partial [Tachysurus ichikawai]
TLAHSNSVTHRLSENLAASEKIMEKGILWEHSLCQHPYRGRDVCTSNPRSRLVPQVTTLVNTSNKGPSSKKKGRSKKAHVLAMSVEQATQNFLEKGEQIAKDSQDLTEELITAVEEVRKQASFLPSFLSFFLSF